MSDLLQMVAIPLETIPFNLPVQFPIYVKVDGRWILFRPKGDTITKERVDSLKARGVGLVYVPEQNWGNYVAGLENGLSFDDGEVPSAQKIVQIRSLLLAYSQEIERGKKFEKIHFQKFQKLGDSLATGIYRHSEIGPKLLRRYSDPSVYFVNHSLNVAIYSAELAKRMSVPLSAAKKLTCGALVHNTGYLFLPKEILYKPGALTQGEWELIYSHPEKGAELLGRMDAPSEVVVVALQHHERVDGKGYPSKRGSRDIHLFARVCSIADVYDALTNNAPYQKANSPKEAIATMFATRGKFDSDILNALTKFS